MLARRFPGWLAEWRICSESRSLSRILTREGLEKFATSSKTGSPVVVLQDEVCFLDWVSCGRQGLIKDRPVMATMLESNRPS